MANCEDELTTWNLYLYDEDLGYPRLGHRNNSAIYNASIDGLSKGGGRSRLACGTSVFVFPKIKTLSRKVPA